MKVFSLLHALGDPFSYFKPESRGALTAVEMESSDDVISARQELVFMDVETTVPLRGGQKRLLVEFEAILVSPRTLLELDRYSTLIKPADHFFSSPDSYGCNDFFRDAAADAPDFAQVADKVFDILDGRVWVGHNILDFDCPRIREAFADIGRPAPVPRDTLDSLTLLTQRFGRRAGDMKMDTLARYFGLGEQKHRSLDDVRMNLEVLKHCAAVLYLESCLPNTFTTNNSVSQNVTTGTVGVAINLELSAADHLDLVPLIDRMNIDSSLHTVVNDEILAPNISGVVSGENTTSNCSNSDPKFLDPDEVPLHSITTSISPHGSAPRILLMPDGIPLQICCTKMRICFEVSSRFLDHAGRPRISIVVEPSPSLCKVLDMCGHLVRSYFMNLGSKSDWWPPVVMKEQGYPNLSTIRLHIPIATPPSTMIYATEISQRETSGDIQRLVFSEVDVAVIKALFVPGSYIDACFSLVAYDYQQNMGIKLVSKKLIIHPCID